MTLYLIRGLPGSGKSTFAKKLNCYHVEADMFFCKDNGYFFDPNGLKDAHGWCLFAASEAMKSQKDVVVSNTFSRKWEISPYLQKAEEYGYDVKIFRMTNQYGSVHNVPKEVIEKMKNRFEDIDGEVFMV